MNKLTTFFKQNRRHILIITCIVFSIIVASVYLWQRKISVDIDRIHYRSYNNYQEAEITNIGSDTVLSQSFYHKGEFDGIIIRMDTIDHLESGVVRVSIIDRTHDTVIYQDQLNAEDIFPANFHHFYFDEPYGFDVDTSYEIVIDSTADPAQNSISVWCSATDYVPNGSLSISGTDISGDMNFGLINNNLQKIKAAYVAVIIFLGLSLIMLYAFVYIFKAKVHVIFLAVAIPFGLVYSLLMSPGVIPDEAAHIDMAYRFSNQWLGISDIGDAAIKYRVTDVENWHLTSIPGAEHYQKLLSTPFWATEGTENSALVAAKTANAYALLYAPSAAGVTFARLIHLGTIPMFYMGRLFNFIVFLVGVFFAIKLAPVGKNIFFVSALLPMTMHQAFSFSYDSIMIGGMFLLIALYLKAIYEEETFRLRDKLLTLLMSVILLPGKAIYVFVTMLALLIPKRRFGGMKKKIIYLGALFLLTGMAYMVVNLSAISTLMSGVQPAEHVGQSFTMGDLIANPLRTVFIFINTIMYNGSYYVKTLVGERMGWLQIYIPTVFVLLALGISGVAFLHDTAEAYIDRSKSMAHRLLYFSIFGLVALAAMFTMLLAYTKFGSEIIDGVQGRYFIPVLPLFGLAVYSRYVKIESGILKHLYMAVGCLHYVILFFLI